MQVRIVSTSPAIARTLEALATAAGHTPTTQDAVAECRFTIDAAGAAAIHITRLRAGEVAQIVPCPARPAQLLSLLRRLDMAPHYVLAHGWSLDTLSRSLSHPVSAAVTLTEKESDLLRALAAAQPASIRREALLTDVWGMSGDVDTHTLETHIYRLRSKLAQLSPGPVDILTEDGAYRLA
jgi:DNA-binding response OmpR family regulator